MATTLDVDEPIPRDELARARWDAVGDPHPMRTPCRCAHLMLGPRLADAHVHVLDPACDLVGATMTEAELVETRVERHVAFGIGGRVDRQPLSTEDVAERLEITNAF